MSQFAFIYNSDGIRTGKRLEEYGETTETVTYYLDGTNIIREIRNHVTDGTTDLFYYYDENGSPIGMSYGGGTTYTYYKNIFGDVLGIFDDSGTLVVRYTYDAWGNIISTTGSMASTLGKDNPFRYRGYYYDTESGFYYLNARYYNPEWGRFISVDPVLDTSSAVGCNLFAYCGNDPINRVDESGCFWGFVFDVISLVSSIIDVCQNPDDPWAWVGLAMDAVDLLPVVSGLGEATRAIKTTDRIVDAADDIHDASKTIDRTMDATKKIDVPTKKVHGKSLDCEKVNYGYALTKKDGTIQKFGETIHLKTRYSTACLERNGLEMQVLVSGSKKDIHFWQHDMNEYYKYKYGNYPPMNKRGW